MPSTVIDSFSYKPDEQRLIVVFVSGRCYSYHGVPFEVYEAMRSAFAKGEYFNQHIRDRYAFTREPSATMLELRRRRS
jgi:lysyl-tRNA synthetase class 2